MNQDFHDHLDVCEQCRNHPTHLCEVGVSALHSTVLSLSSERTTGAVYAVDRVVQTPHSTSTRDPESSTVSDFAALKGAQAQTK